MLYEVITDTRDAHLYKVGEERMYCVAFEAPPVAISGASWTEDGLPPALGELAELLLPSDVDGAHREGIRRQQDRPHEEQHDFRLFIQPSQPRRAACAAGHAADNNS